MTEKTREESTHLTLSKIDDFIQKIQILIEIPENKQRVSHSIQGQLRGEASVVYIQCYLFLPLSFFYRDDYWTVSVVSIAAGKKARDLFVRSVKRVTGIHVQEIHFVCSLLL